VVSLVFLNLLALVRSGGESKPAYVLLRLAGVQHLTLKVIWIRCSNSRYIKKLLLIAIKAKANQTNSIALIEIG